MEKNRLVLSEVKPIYAKRTLLKAL